MSLNRWKLLEEHPGLTVGEIYHEHQSNSLNIGLYDKGHNFIYVPKTKFELVIQVEPTIDKGDKYRKAITGNEGTITVDVYDVLKAFKVTCPAMQHAIKKMLCAGLRGHKDIDTDINEAIHSLTRAKELLND